MSSVYSTTFLHYSRKRALILTNVQLFSTSKSFLRDKPEIIL